MVVDWYLTQARPNLKFVNDNTNIVVNLNEKARQEMKSFQIALFIYDRAWKHFFF